ncbi:MAG: hypothetical protein ABFC42_12505 [Sulfuricella sp.]
MADGFIAKRWLISVAGYGSGVEIAATRGQALAKTWRCDAFGNMPFKRFLSIANAVIDRDPPARWGDRITVCGEPAFFTSSNRAYVEFVRPSCGNVRHAHPYDVLPIEYRPEAYRDTAAAQPPAPNPDHKGTYIRV